ncbi:MAG: DUF58 domain-containing protein [Pseudomonadota bacterium]
MLPSLRLAGLCAALSTLTLGATLWPQALWAGLAAQLTLLACALLDGLLIHGQPKPQVRRVLPSKLVLHRPAEVRLDVSGLRRDERIVLADTPPSFLHSEAHRGEFLVGGETATLKYQVLPLQRGAWSYGPVELRRRGPLGLVHRRWRWSLDDSIEVLPDLAAAGRAALAIRKAHRLGAGRGVRGAAGSGREFDSLRPYVRGDDVRLVDWKATARRRQPVVRHDQAERHQNVLLVLDAGRHMTARSRARRGAGQASKLDLALEAALALACAAIDVGDRVGALIFDDKPRHFVPCGTGRRHLHQLSRRIGMVQARLVEADPAAALAVVLHRLARRSLVCLFTDVSDPLSARALVEAQRVLARRHLVLVVALRDPDFDRDRGVHDPASDSFERLAVHELLTLRGRALHLLSSAGAAVVDVGAHQIRTSTLDAYLDIKLRGRL